MNAKTPRHPFKRGAVRLAVGAGTLLGLASSLCAAPIVKECSQDSVKIGDTCLDKYEASVWVVPNPTTASSKALVRKVVDGEVTLADLQSGGATQVLGCEPSSDYPANFPFHGNWTPLPGTNPPTPGVYAVSVGGVLPSVCISWLQAEQACALSGKRLLRNQEWQRAAAGTPDPGATPGASDCNTNSAALSPTGSRSNCTSVWGVFDMVGNAEELVGDWAELAEGCADWSSNLSVPGNDISCFAGSGGEEPNQRIPSTVQRGGSFFDGAAAGVLAITARGFPVSASSATGFRCAR